MRESLSPEERLFDLAFQGINGGKRKASYIGGLPGRSNETGICINGHLFMLLEAFIQNKDAFWNEKTFTHGLYMMPAFETTPSRFILITKERKIISSSFDDAADLTCFAFFVSQNSEKLLQRGTPVPIISLKGVFNKNVSAVTSVEDPEIYKLWRLEAKQIKDSFSVYRSQGDMLDETELGYFGDEDGEYAEYL